MARSGKTPRICLGFLFRVSISLTFSIPPPAQRQPTLPFSPLVLPTSALAFLAVRPDAVPADPYLMKIDRYIYQYFKHCSNPPLGTPSFLAALVRKLRDQIVIEASSHGGSSGTLTNLDFCCQKGGFLLNFAMNWDPRQEGESQPRRINIWRLSQDAWMIGGRGRGERVRYWGATSHMKRPRRRAHVCR